MRVTSMLIAFVLTMAAGLSNATEIYKWVDDEGNVYFVDKPTGAPGEEHLGIRSRPTNQARVQASVQARQGARDTQAEAESSAPQGPSAEEQRATAQERAEKCDKYRERQTRFTESRRIYRMDENGERVWYSEEEVQAARDKVDEQVAQYCS